MRARLLAPFAFALASVTSLLVACVSDSKALTSPTSDAATQDGAVVTTQDSSTGDSAVVEEDAGACKVPTANGINCFGEPRCKAIFEVCCVSLGGGGGGDAGPGTLTGACIAKGDAALKTCQDANAVLWECDRGKDCPSGGSRCCVPNVFKLVDPDSCPMKIGLDDQGGPPSDGKATRCVQGASCNAGDFTACETSAECPAAQVCVPAKVQDKVFGLCVTR